jgi:hypothetical protein
MAPSRGAHTFTCILNVSEVLFLVFFVFQLGLGFTVAQFGSIMINIKHSTTRT